MVIGIGDPFYTNILVPNVFTNDSLAKLRKEMHKEIDHLFDNARRTT
jgi:hypothetical protein